VGVLPKLNGYPESEASKDQSPEGKRGQLGEPALRSKVDMLLFQSARRFGDLLRPECGHRGLGEGRQVSLLLCLLLGPPVRGGRLC
jgi:hypothetical protein